MEPDKPLDQLHPKHQPKRTKDPSDKVAQPYSEPQPVLDSTSDFERMDRGEGMAVDDEKTYHRTER